MDDLTTESPGTYIFNPPIRDAADSIMVPLKPSMVLVHPVCLTEVLQTQAA